MAGISFIGAGVILWDTAARTVVGLCMRIRGKDNSTSRHDHCTRVLFAGGWVERLSERRKSNPGAGSPHE